MFPERNLHYASSNIFMDRAYEPHIHHADRITSLGGLMPRTKGKLYSAAGYAATLPRDRRTSEQNGEHGVDMFHEDPLTLKRGDNLRFFRKKPYHIPHYSPYLNNLENQRKVHQYQREAELIAAQDPRAYIPRAEINLEPEMQPNQAPHRSYDERARSREQPQQRAYSRQEQHTQAKDSLDVEINRSLDPSSEQRTSQFRKQQYLEEQQAQKRNQEMPSYKQGYLKNINPPPGMESRILRDFDRKGYAPVVGSVGLQMLKPKSLQPSSMYRLNMVQAPGLAAPPTQYHTMPEERVRSPQSLQNGVGQIRREQGQARYRDYYQDQLEAQIKQKERVKQVEMERKDQARHEIEEYNQEYLNKETELNLHKKNYQQAYYDILQDQVGVRKWQIRTRDEIKHLMIGDAPQRPAYTPAHPQTVSGRFKKGVQEYEAASHPDYSGMLPKSDLGAMKRTPSPRQMKAAEQALLNPKVAEYYITAEGRPSELVRNPITNPQSFEINSPYLLKELASVKSRRP